MSRSVRCGWHDTAQRERPRVPSNLKTEFAITKFLPPKLRRSLVLRQSLAAVLSSGVDRKLVLVTAPAGFGKTTLLTQYYDHMRNLGIRPCWLSLDQRDQNPSRFLVGIIRSLQTITSDLARTVSGLVEVRPGTDVDRLVDALINDVAAYGQKIALFLDDYHEADGPVVSALMTRLLTLMPQNLHIVVASRHVPQLNLAVLRLHDELTEINASALRFTTAETRDFMCNMRGHTLSNDDITSLHAQTEGWVAALQITSLSLETSGNTALEGLGPQRGLVDYLTMDIYAHLETDIQDFLLSTSVLDQMTPSLCDYVTGRDDSALMLQRIERANLFLVSLDSDREWYRYHHLFRSFLKTELVRNNGQRVEQLCRRASDWFATRNIAEEAIDYARKSGDYARMAELVELFAGEHFRFGRILRLISWIREIPQAVLRYRPWLSLYLAYALFHLRHRDEVESILTQSSIDFSGGQENGHPYDDRMRADFENKVEAIRIGVASVAEGDASLIQRITKLSSKTPTQEPTYQCTLLNILGYLQICHSDHKTAAATLYRARMLNAQYDFVYGIVYADCFLGLNEAVQGHLAAAVAFYTRAAALAADKSGPHSLGHDLACLLYGIALLEQNKITEARPLIVTSAPIAGDFGPIEVYVQAHVAQARLAAHDGDLAAALSLLDPTAEAVRPSVYRVARLALAVQRIRLLCDAGHVDAAVRTALDVGVEEVANVGVLSTSNRWTEETCLAAVIQVEIAIASGHAATAVPVATALKRHMAANGRRQHELTYAILEIRALLAAAHQDMARDRLFEIFRLIYPENYARPFIENIPNFFSLLKDMLQVYPESRAFVPEGLKADLAVPITAAVTIGGDNYFLIEPLSDREREVLAHLAIGKSNQEIAKATDLAVNTIKWHIQNIFGKLGVSNRTSATLAAQHLGLI